MLLALRLWYAESAFTSSSEGKPDEPVTDSLESYGLGYFNGHYRGEGKKIICVLANIAYLRF